MQNYFMLAVAMEVSVMTTASSVICVEVHNCSVEADYFSTAPDEE